MLTTDNRFFLLGAERVASPSESSGGSFATAAPREDGDDVLRVLGIMTTRWCQSAAVQHRAMDDAAATRMPAIV